MVKKITIFLLFLLAIIYISYPPKLVIARSFKEITIGVPPNDVGKLIASSGGFKMIEFWHYSGGYWKATTVTESGSKEIIIRDNEAADGAWEDPDFLLEKIYINKFVLEYKIWHPQKVLDALALGEEITPVMSIDTGILSYTDEYTIPTNFFNFEPLPSDLPTDSPEKPEYALFDSHIQIRALPKLNCIKQRSIKNELSFGYPHEIPIVQPSFGSLSYAMYHHDGSHTGVGYSPDPFYKDMNTIGYNIIQDIQGRLVPGFPVTTSTNPERKDEESGELRIGYGTFQNAGAVCIRFWYPIRIDYYAKGTDETTPTPTPTSTSTTPSPIPEPEGESITENLQDENISSHET